MSRRHRKAHPCPHATKTAYSTPEIAAAALAEILAVAPRDGERRPIRTYRCSCLRWHLTSQPLGQPASERSTT